MAAISATGKLVRAVVQSMLIGGPSKNEFADLRMPARPHHQQVGILCTAPGSLDTSLI